MTLERIWVNRRRITVTQVLLVIDQLCLVDVLCQDLSIGNTRRGAYRETTFSSEMDKKKNGAEMLFTVSMAITICVRLLAR